MTLPVNTKLDFGGARRIINLGQAAANGEPIVYEQFIAAQANMAWKDDARVAGQVNVTVASPGATIDGVTMASGDRVLLFNQTTGSENGIYIWNGTSTPMTRSLDAQAWSDLKSATIKVSEGTSANLAYQQTIATGTIGTTTPVFTQFGTAAPAASTSTAGILQIATQAEVDAGTVSNKAVTPLTLATYANRVKKYAATIGDGTATSITVTHNLNSTDVVAQLFEATGSKREVLVEKQITSVNAVTFLFDSAPALNSLRAVVIA